MGPHRPALQRLFFVPCFYLYIFSFPRYNIPMIKNLTLSCNGTKTPPSLQKGEPVRFAIVLPPGRDSKEGPSASENIFANRNGICSGAIAPRPSCLFLQRTTKHHGLPLLYKQRQGKQIKRVALIALLFTFALCVAGRASAQTTPTLGEKSIGTSCSNGANAVNFDTLAQCSATNGSGTFQKSPLFVGKVTSPPYASTACDSTKAGMLQFNGTVFQGCDGTSWGGIPTSLILGTSAVNTSPFRSGDITTGLFSGAASTVSLSTAGLERVTVDPNGNFGIGTTSPSYLLHLLDQNNAGFMLREYNNADGAALRLSSAGGTAAAPTALVLGNVVGGIRAFGAVSTSGFSNLAASIDMMAAENFTTSAHGTNITFRTTPIGSTTLREVMQITAGGFVGIGTSSPDNKVQITNDGSCTFASDGGCGQLVLTGASNPNKRLGFMIDTTNNVGVIQAALTSSNAYNLGLNPAGGNVGIGTTSPIDLLTIGTSPPISFGTNAAGCGIVGMAFSSSAATCGTVPAILVGGDNNMIFEVPSGSSYSFRINNAALPDALHISTTGSIGIGTTSPNRPLQVQGSSTQVSLRNSSAAAGAYWAIGPDDSSNNFVVYNQDGVGAFIANGGTGWAAGSDKRLKKNIETYQVLDKIARYRAVSFDWKQTGRHEVGVIAQELYPIFPEIVIKGDDDPNEKVSIGGKNAWGVSYDRLGALSMEGVKELYETVKKLKAENDDLRATMKAQNDEFRARLDELESRLKEHPAHGIE